MTAEGSGSWGSRRGATLSPTGGAGCASTLAGGVAGRGAEGSGVRGLLTVTRGGVRAGRAAGVSTVDGGGVSRGSTKGSADRMAGGGAALDVVAGGVGRAAVAAGGAAAGRELGGGGCVIQSPSAVTRAAATAVAPSAPTRCQRRQART